MKRTMGLKSGLLASISALLYHPELKLMAIGITNKRPIGMPTKNCRKSFFWPERFFSQYRRKASSSFVSIHESYVAKVPPGHNNLSFSTDYEEVFLSCACLKSYQFEIITAFIPISISDQETGLARDRNIYPGSCRCDPGRVRKGGNAPRGRYQF
jgi:hypothetical protein